MMMPQNRMGCYVINTLGTEIIFAALSKCAHVLSILICHISSYLYFKITLSYLITVTHVVVGKGPTGFRQLKTSTPVMGPKLLTNLCIKPTFL